MTSYLDVNHIEIRFIKDRSRGRKLELKYRQFADMKWSEKHTFSVA